MADIKNTGGRILIVEDDGIISTRLESILPKFGYDVSGVAAFGEEVIQKVCKATPDLILMDIYLAGDLNGIETATQIHAKFDIPVVYLTAFADDELLQQAKVTEPYGYMVKPIQDKELRATIEMALSRHKLETKLKDNEHWLDTMLRSIGDAVIATDEKCSVTFMNPVAEELTGWKQEEALGHDLIEIFHIVNEATGDLAENPVEKVIQEGTIAGLANHTLLIKKDGTTIPIDDKAAPFQDDKGNITGVVLIFRDITEHKQAEYMLRKSEERYRKLSEELEQRIRQRTAELRKYVNFMAGREVRMAELKDIIQQLREQLKAAGLTPIANDRAVAYREEMELEKLDLEVPKIDGEIKEELEHERKE